MTRANSKTYSVMYDPDDDTKKTKFVWYYVMLQVYEENGYQRSTEKCIRQKINQPAKPVPYKTEINAGCQFDQEVPPGNWRPAVSALAAVE